MALVGFNRPDAMKVAKVVGDAYRQGAVTPPGHQRARSIPIKPGVIVAVTLEQDGGAEGTATTACTFTYTATYLTGEAISTTGLSPEHSSRGEAGIMLVATRGGVYRDYDGVVHLAWANERPATSECNG
jgi:hypothetical protein